MANYRENESLLLAVVEKAGLKPVAAPVYARYNSPLSLPFIRRNETMVEVRGMELVGWVEERNPASSGWRMAHRSIVD